MFSGAAFVLGTDLLVEQIGMNSQNLYETIFQTETGVDPSNIALATSPHQPTSSATSSEEAVVDLNDKHDGSIASSRNNNFRIFAVCPTYLKS